MKSFKKLVCIALIGQLCMSSTFAQFNNMSKNTDKMDLEELNFDLTSTSWEDTDDATNSDYNVESSEIKQWDLKVTNWWANIDWTLYVYWNLTVTNDNLKVNWKLKVTWNLIVTNGNIINNWRIYVFGKKKIVNWNTIWKPTKLNSNVAKFDPFLKADLSKEEFEQVQSMVNDFYTEIETQKKELKSTVKNKWDVDSVKENIIKIRDNFYTDLEWFIQSNDIEQFNKIKNKEVDLLNKFMDQYKGNELLSSSAKQMIIKKINAIPEEKREEFIRKIIENIDKVAEKAKNENKKALLMAIKKVFEKEYDKYSAYIIENLDRADQWYPTNSGSNQTSTWSVSTWSTQTSTWSSMQMSWNNSTQVTTGTTVSSWSTQTGNNFSTMSM